MAAPPQKDPAPAPTRAEELLRESTLWPLWAVVVGHAVAFLAPVMLMATRDRQLPAMAALAILVVATGAGLEKRIRTRGGIGPLYGTLLATWLLAAGAAWVAHRVGVF